MLRILDIRVLPFQVNDLCYVRYKALDSMTILCFAMAQPLATEITWESTQFFNFNSKVATNLELAHQDTMFFDAVSGNDNPNPNQPESEMTENNDMKMMAQTCILLRCEHHILTYITWIHGQIG